MTVTTSLATAGTSAPLGATVSAGGVNFSVSSKHATRVDLLLFDSADARQPEMVIPLDPHKQRTYHYWHAFVPFLEPGQVYACMVRSAHAHGVLRGIEVEKAKAMPGVLAVYTAADLQGYGPHKCLLSFNNRDGSPMKRPVRRSLAADKVRFVGDPVACVIAQTAVQAKDAAEAVELDIEPLPAVTLASEAAKPGARARSLQ